MTKLTPQRAAVFIGVFAIFGLLLDQVGSSRPSRFTAPRETERPVSAEKVAHSTETVEDKAVLRAEEERRKLIARYINTATPKRAGATSVAVAIIGEGGRYSGAINSALAETLRSSSVQVLQSFFRPEFVSDGLFDSVYSGSNEAVDKLELSKSLDALVLGKQEVRYSTDPSLENLVTANMQLEITTISLATGESRSWTLIANGAGFKQTEARLMAEERLLKQIVKDTKISL